MSDLPAIQPILRHKAVTKLLSAYDKGYLKYRHPVTDRLHSEFSLGNTRSGRVACSSPNVQNPPRLPAFRELFIPAPGRVLVGADFGQIELRVAALLSGDPAMLEAYRNGVDLHRLTAAAVVGVDPATVTDEQRQAAKAVNFGNLYGQRPSGLARTAQLDYGVTMTPDEARQALGRFEQAYPKLGQWKRSQVLQGRQLRQVRTQLGLVRDFDVQGEGYLEGEAQNIPVQGSAAEVLLCSLRRLPDALSGCDAYLYHNIHDEIVLDVSEADAEQAEQALEQVMVAGFLEVFPEGDDLVTKLVAVKRGDSWSAVH